MIDKKSRRDKRGLAIRVGAIFLVLALLLGMVISAIPAFAGPARPDPKDKFEMEIQMLEDEQALHVVQRLTYHNRTGTDLESVMFNLYANIYRRQESAPFEGANLESCYPDGFAPGGLDMQRVEVNGQTAEWAVQGDYEIFMRVECPLEDGDSAEFTFEYYVLLPACTGRFGVGDMDWRITNFYPVPAVYLLGDFQLEPYSAIGEPFFSEIADYSVTLDAPDTYLVASSGLATPGESENGRRTWTIEGQDLRELDMVISRKYTETTRQSGSGVQLYAYGNGTSASNRALEAADRAFGFFTEKLGESGLTRFTVAESGYYRDQMAKPGLAVISEELFERGQAEDLEYQVVNAVALQWTRFLVGSDASLEPWLSESMANYLTLLYYEETYGHDRFLEELNEQVLDSLRVTVPGNLTVDSAAERFNSQSEYDMIILGRGAAVFHELKGAMGGEAFWAALKRYFQDNAGGIVSIADFAAALNEGAEHTWDDFLMNQLYNIGDYVNQRIEWYE